MNEILLPPPARAVSGGRRAPALFPTEIGRKWRHYRLSPGMRDKRKTFFSSLNIQVEYEC
jgi:hypothetical protein